MPCHKGDDMLVPGYFSKVLGLFTSILKISWQIDLDEGLHQMLQIYHFSQNQPCPSQKGLVKRDGIGWIALVESTI
jgi:hypothetical protein